MGCSLFKNLQEEQLEAYKPRDLIIDMDSTYHVHYGQDIEGVSWNYKNEWSLESQVAFSSLGFCHGLQLRPGNTKSGVDAVWLLDRIFNDGRTQYMREKQGRDYFRSDSAYCYQEVIRCCLRKGLLFTLTANDATTGWKSQMESEGLVWQDWEYSEEEKSRAASRGKELPHIELSKFYWQPGWSDEKLLFPIVVKREWQAYRKKEKAQESLFAPDTVHEYGEWKYYAVVTNFGLSKWSLQSVMEFHQKRGNAENFIKEEKYNFKLKNFPCQKLLANHAWILLSQVAHNMIRWIALMDSPDKPHYSKKIRNKYMFIAGKVVSHARQITLRIMRKDYERGLKNLVEGWQFPERVSAQMFSVPSG